MHHMVEFGSTFEHGQLWIHHNPSGASWSVCDAIGPGSLGGFCFEMVADGDEEAICWTEAA
ncbi:MAG: hypothetical protein ABIL58_12370 [Pseudomonadota bacterium]